MYPGCQGRLVPKKLARGGCTPQGMARQGYPHHQPGPNPEAAGEQGKICRLRKSLAPLAAICALC
jgi:hypothetical protein